MVLKALGRVIILIYELRNIGFAVHMTPHSYEPHSYVKSNHGHTNKRG